MRSIILSSYRRNLRSYCFFIIALALALFVCSLGVSGIRLMASLWRYPYLQGDGGHIVIRTRPEGNTRSDRVMTLLSRSQVEGIARSIFPEAELTATVEVPSIIWFPNDQRFIDSTLVGRDNGLTTWYLLPPRRYGVTLSQDNLGQSMFVLRGLHLDNDHNPVDIPIRVATYIGQGESESWQLVGAPEQRVTLTGTTGQPSMPGLWGHLSVVQQLASVPPDRVNRVGIALPGLAVQLDDRVQQLRDRLAQEMPELEVMTVDDYARLEQSNMLELQAAAGSYTPIVIGLALLSVAATALALVQSRRRELALLRIIGMSKHQVWLLFVTECVFSAVLALLLALLLLIMGADVLLRTGSIPLTPFVFSMLAAIGISMVIARVAVAKSIPSTLRSA